MRRRGRWIPDWARQPSAIPAADSPPTARRWRYRELTRSRRRYWRRPDDRCNSWHQERGTQIGTCRAEVRDQQHRRDRRRKAGHRVQRVQRPVHRDSAIQRHAGALPNQEDIASGVGPVHQQPEKDHADEKEDQGDGQTQHIEIGKIGEALREAADTFITGRSRHPRQQQCATAEQV